MGEHFNFSKEKMVKHSKEMIEERLKLLEEKMEEQSVKMDSMMERVDSIHDLLSKQAEYNKDSSKMKNAHISSAKNHSLQDQVHKDVLQEEFQYIVNTLNFSNTHILEFLLQNQGISESDHEMILNQKARKDQNRYLVYRMRKYDEANFNIFLESLETECADLAEHLRSSCEKKRTNSIQARKYCLHCMIIRHVDIGDILDPLFQARLIDDTIIEHHILHKTSNTLLWTQLFYQLKICHQEEKCKKVLSSSLKDKYKEIAKSIEDHSLNKTCSCTCFSIPACENNDRVYTPSSFRSLTSGSLSDISSSSSTSQENAEEIKDRSKLPIRSASLTLHSANTPRRSRKSNPQVSNPLEQIQRSGNPDSFLPFIEKYI